MINLLGVSQPPGASINWLDLMVTALVCVAVSVTTPWLTFQLVKRREMAEGLRVEVEKLELVKKPGLAQTLRNEIERQRETLRLELEKVRYERIGWRCIAGQIRFLGQSKICVGG